MSYDFSELQNKLHSCMKKSQKMVSGGIEKVEEMISSNPNFNTPDLNRDLFMLKGRFASQGYDWWWHNFTGINAKTREEKVFFIEYFVINPALAEDEPVFGQLPENIERGRKPSYFMVKAGTWGEDARQLHRFFSINDTKISDRAPFSIEADDCYASEGRLAGSVEVSEADKNAHPEWMSDAGSMKWSISVDKKIAYNVGYGASKPLRDLTAFEMYWHAEGMKTEYSGTVELDGELYYVSPETSYGYADKNWGADFTSPWLWLSSNNLISNTTGKRLKNSVFDIGGGRPKAFGLELEKKLLGAMYYEGEEMEFNFSKVWMKPKTKFKCTETDEEVIWHVEQENSVYIMQTRIHCKKREMLLINYEAPDGSKKHNRLWNGGTGEGWIRLYKKENGEKVLIDVLEARNVGCEWGEFC